jgi:DNA repair exonuclease SbcCD nuclease subunit
VVEAAIEAEVDAVALAGDVVDRENDFFEAFRELHSGVERLAAADIRVLGVVGNHDVTILPRLAEQIEAFELLGGGGEWQTAEIEAGGETITLWGWSFPRARVPESPLARVEFERRTGPNLGLLHCDRDQAGSPYAPVSRRELEAAGLDGWLLGHIHQPDMLTAPHPSGYLGSVTGMDPGEPGARGPWLVTVDGGRIREVEQWVLAPLRWERLEVDIEGISEPEEARDRLLDHLREFDAGVAAGRWPPKAVGLRVYFTGRTRFGEAAVALVSGEDREHVDTGEGETHYFIERLEAVTRPEILLEELAKRNDPPGLLARRLQLLDGSVENPERQKLLADARRKLEAQTLNRQWRGLRVEPPDEETTVGWLRRSGMRLLDRLIAQQESES